ncbi:MAG: glycosyltransferase family A protein [Pseudomonadota bacterium]|nr:glycosyltransferase family A protein [Pseudomonadota bacterium]
MTQTQPIVSIILAVRNDAAGLKDTIAAIEAQIDTRWRMYIVDDASDDDTAETAAEIAKEKERIVLIRASESGGIARARNVAIQASNEPFVLCLEAGDIPASGMLARCLGLLIANGRLDAVFVRPEFTDADLDEETINKAVNASAECAVIRRRALLFSGGWPVDDAFTGVAASASGAALVQLLNRHFNIAFVNEQLIAKRWCDGVPLTEWARNLTIENGRIANTGDDDPIVKAAKAIDVRLNTQRQRIRDLIMLSGLSLSEIHALLQNQGAARQPSVQEEAKAA